MTSSLYPADASVSDREPPTHQHGGAADLHGVSGRPGAGEGGQHALPPTPADTHPCGDPHGQSVEERFHSQSTSLMHSLIELAESQGNHLLFDLVVLQYTCLFWYFFVFFQVIIATVVAYASSLDSAYDVQIVGHIPAG